MTNRETPKTINWAIIGLGNIAHKFATDILTVKDAKLYAVASRKQEKANAFATKYGVQKAYGSYKALVQDTNIDAVYIATPHALHKENTLLCLENSIAVLCEKPLAINTKDVQQMITKAKQTKTLLMEALWTVFLPHYQHVLKLLKDEVFGKLVKIDADFGFNRPYDTSHRLFNKTLGGGSLLDIGIYPVFVALSTLGIPNSIKAQATYFKNGTDATCIMVFNYKNNIKANLKSSLTEKTPTEAIFYCENGTIIINSMFHAPTTVTLKPNVGHQETLEFGYNTIGYNYEAAHFTKLIQQGKTESNIMTFEFSTTLIQTLDKIREDINLEY